MVNSQRAQTAPAALDSAPAFDAASESGFSPQTSHVCDGFADLVPAVKLWTRTPSDKSFDSAIDSMAGAKYVYFDLSGLNDDPPLAVQLVTALNPRKRMRRRNS